MTDGTAAMVVRDYMTSQVDTLNDDACLLDAALLIRRTGKRHVPVINADGKPVGIISDRDVARLAPSILSQLTPEQYNQVFEATPITSAMSPEPICLAPDAPVREAVGLFYGKKIGALLVVENEKLAGILTISDMLGLLYQLLSEQVEAAGLGGMQD